MTIRALIADDEPLARQRLARLLSEHPDLELVGEADGGDTAIAQVLGLRPDLLLLDVQMPGKDGLQALRGIHDALPEELWPLVVFTTAFEEHALEAFALEGTDYLLKPVERRELGRALRRVRKRIWATQPVAPAAASPPPPAPSPAPAPAAGTPGEGERGQGHLAAHRAGRIVRLALDDVAWVNVEDTITFAHTPAGRYRLKMTLADAQSRLPSPPFVRVSRSAILQLGWVQHVVPGESGTYTAVLRPPLESTVAVSRRRARQLRELLGW